jgi:hypothetical protein
VLVAHACNPSYLGGRDQEDFTLKTVQANILKIKRADRVAQVVEHLPSKGKALSSSPILPKKNHIIKSIDTEKVFTKFNRFP